MRAGIVLSRWRRRPEVAPSPAMKWTIVGLVLVALPNIARAEEQPLAVETPATGTAWIVWGSLLTAGGVGNLVTAPLCELSRVSSSQRPACLATSIGVGGALLAAGIPLLVVGVQKRSTWLDWQRTTVAPLRSGAVLQLGGAW